MMDKAFVDEDQVAAFLDRIEKAKHARRIELARLPFPEKVRIIVELQKIYNELAKAGGREQKIVWDI
ncbi:MAG: hypothetical protein NTY09_12090 [bacterium]|nr:hypothetical protein [bacterium]